MDFLNNAILAPVYYAGLFDSEGSVSLYMNRYKIPTLSIRLTNSFHPALMYPMNKFGGIIENNKSTHINWADTFSWRVYSQKAYEFLEWVYPFTIIKKDQIDIIIEFWKLYKPNQSMQPDQTIVDQYIATLKSLKRGK